MFCEKCGKEIKDNWKKCPYCGQATGENSEKTRTHSKEEQQVDNSFEKIPKKKSKIKRVLLGIGVLLVIMIFLAVISPSDEDNGNDKLRQKDKDIPEGAEVEELYERVNPNETEEIDEDNIGMYLINEGGLLPIQIMNVYQESVYSGFTTFSFDVVNKSDVDVKEATFGIVAWDSNMLPLELTAMYDIDSTYFYKCNDDNIAVGQTKQASIAFEGGDFKYIQILLLEYSDFDGNIWTNPVASYYEQNFAGKKYDENTMTAMIFGE